MFTILDNPEDFFFHLVKVYRHRSENINGSGERKREERKKVPEVEGKKNVFTANYRVVLVAKCPTNFSHGTLVIHFSSDISVIQQIMYELKDKIPKIMFYCVYSWSGRNIFTAKRRPSSQTVFLYIFSYSKVLLLLQSIISVASIHDDNI